jgi:hypothetical protein
MDSIMMDGVIAGGISRILHALVSEEGRWEKGVGRRETRGGSPLF